MELNYLQDNKLSQIICVNTSLDTNELSQIICVNKSLGTSFKTPQIYFTTVVGILKQLVTSFSTVQFNQINEILFSIRFVTSNVL